jgi:glycosyltransferase involved in cell wall biosynthesis
VLLPVHWSAGMGGAEYQARLLVEHWGTRYDADLVYLTTRASPHYDPPGYRLVQFSTDRGIRRYGTFFDARQLYRALHTIAPDVIYQQVGCAHTGVAAFYAARAGCKMYWRISSDRSLTPPDSSWWRRPHHRLERLFLDYGIRRADTIFAQNARQQRLLRERYGRDSVLVHSFHPMPSEPVSSVPSGRRTILWVGNLKRLKNPAAFLRLAREFEARADLEFVMIGAPGDDPRWTEELLAAIARHRNVHYLGPLAQDEVNARLSRAFMLVNTSDYEGFPNTFVQAWLRGVPVLSLHADPDDLLKNGVCGRLSGTEEALREDLRQLVAAPELTKRIGRSARAYAAGAHSMDNADRIARLIGLPATRAGGAAASCAGRQTGECANVALGAG